MEPAFHQRGAALLVSLIILLVLTVLAVSSMQGASLQERMVAAQRDAQMALEGAEHALTEAQALLSQPTVPSLTDTDGLFTENSENVPVGRTMLFDPDTWNDDVLSRAATMPAIDGIDMLDSPPRYFIQQLSADAIASNNELPLNAGDKYGAGGNQQAATVFRIVARGTGGSGQASRIIEAFVAR